MLPLPSAHSKAEEAATGRLAGALTEKGVLQLLMDTRFMRDVLAGGRPLGPLPAAQQQPPLPQGLGAEVTGGSEASDRHVVAALMERRRQGLNLEQHLQVWGRVGRPAFVGLKGRLN